MLTRSFEAALTSRRTVRFTQQQALSYLKSAKPLEAARPVLPRLLPPTNCLRSTSSMRLDPFTGGNEGNVKGYKRSCWQAATTQA